MIIPITQVSCIYIPTVLPTSEWGNKPLQCLDEETQPLKQQKKGKPTDSIKAYAFIKVVDYLQSHDDKQTTIHELIKKMRTILPADIEPYGFTHDIIYSRSFWR